MDHSEIKVLLIEPFYGGSHQQLMDLLATLPGTKLITMPAKKWHWRARTAALHLSEIIPYISSLKTLFASSVLNLCELTSLRSDLAKLQKIIYFHENQLNYPVQQYKDRDFQYGYNQILSCLVADVVLFNSHFNKDSFLSSISIFLKAVPDHKPKYIVDRIKPKCQVIYFPMVFPICKPFHNDSDSSENKGSDIQLSKRELFKEKNQAVDMMGAEMHHSALHNVTGNSLHILWPHRWEHDKNPELFFQTIMKLKGDKCDFKLSVLGEQFSEIPDIFNRAREELSDHIIAWGFQSRKNDYYQILYSADVVVSTADHEFYGVSMLEAVSTGCVPLCPRRLVYPELYPDQFLYNTDQQLYKKLKNFCELKKRGRFARRTVMELRKYSWETLRNDFVHVLYQS